MAYSRNYESNDNDQYDGIDPVVDQSKCEEFEDSSSSNSMGGSGVGFASRNEVLLEERLTEIFVDERDGDLLLQQNNQEDRVMQWLQALDMQVMGACRTDERLKPMLKTNVSNGAAEDRLLAHLSKHFDPVEVGMLARCFCMPLVSIRVGKIDKQGTLLSPTAARGNLNLTILPTSDLCLLFIGDDGCVERLLTLRSKSQCSAVTINEISSDPSNRSSFIKTPSCEVFYFWCSENSKLLGVELLAKMKDILMRKPSIAELTGISESRLDCFATHLRAYLVGSTVGGTETGQTESRAYLNSTYEQYDLAQDEYLSPTSSKSLQSRHTGNQPLRTDSPFQGSLNPRSSSFKEGLSINLTSVRNAAQEKLGRLGDNHFTTIGNSATASSAADTPYDPHFENEKLPEVVRSCSLPPLCFLDSLEKLVGPPLLSSAPQVPKVGTSFLSPYCCWYPPGAGPLQCPTELTQPASPNILSPLLPPLSSLLPATMPSSLSAQTPLLDMMECPSIHFPSLLPDSYLSRPISQQIQTFIPLMCDPIVHIPVINVCSSGQGYLVSAGPTLSTTIPTLCTQFVNPLIPKTDSVVEKGARDTLRLLISGSSQTNSPLMDVLPAVDGKSGVFVAGSRGFYGGTRDVHAIASSIAAIRLASLSGRSEEETSLRRSSHFNFDAKQEGSSVTSISCIDNEDAMFSDPSKERSDQ